MILKPISSHDYAENRIEEEEPMYGCKGTYNKAKVFAALLLLFGLDCLLVHLQIAVESPPQMIWVCANSWSLSL